MTVFQIKVTNLKAGDRVFINAINLTNCGVRDLRKFIADGVLKLSDFSKSMIVPEALPDFENGKSILPQAEYIKA